VVNLLEGRKMCPNIPQGHKMRIVSVQVSLLRQMRYSYKIVVWEIDERIIHMEYTLIHEDT
jgi:hypothetical protein